jgi:hypothetical protein
MSLLDNLGNLLAGSGKRTQPIELQPGEREVFRTAGAVLAGGLSLVGGEIVVTNQRLLFTPLNVSDGEALLAAGLKRAGAPEKAVALVGYFARRVNDAATETDVVSIREGQHGSLFKPPSVVVQGSSGRSIELGVLADPRSANAAAGNYDARRRLITAVQATIGPPGQAVGVGRSEIGVVGTPRVRPDTIASTTTAALTEAEADAQATFEELPTGMRIFMPMARAQSQKARLDAQLVGTWQIPDTGTVSLGHDGLLTVTMQLFGALPPGRVTGQWWIDGVPEALVLNFVCVQTNGEQEVEFATSYAMPIASISPTELTIRGADGTTSYLRRSA